LGGRGKGRERGGTGPGNFSFYTLIQSHGEEGETRKRTEEKKGGKKNLLKLILDQP